MRVLGVLFASVIVGVACGGDVFVAPDAAPPSDGSPPPGDAGGDGATCSYPVPTAADRACDLASANPDANCAAVLFPTDCCGAEVLGINHGLLTSFTTKDMQATAGCVCMTGCAAQPRDEFGKPVSCNGPPFACVSIKCEQDPASPSKNVGKCVVAAN